MPQNLDLSTVYGYEETIKRPRTPLLCTMNRFILERKSRRRSSVATKWAHSRSRSMSLLLAPPGLSAHHLAPAKFPDPTQQPTNVTSRRQLTHQKQPLLQASNFSRTTSDGVRSTALMPVRSTELTAQWLRLIARKSFRVAAPLPIGQFLPQPLRFAVRLCVA